MMRALIGSVLIVCSFAAWSSTGQVVRQVAQSSDAASQARGERALTMREQVLQKLLYTRVSVNFDQTPAKDAFEYLRTVLDIPIIVRYWDDRHPSGIDPEMPITFRIENVPAHDVLEMILDQCADLEACTWQLRSSYLEVGTKTRLSMDGAQEIKVYPVQELLVDPIDFRYAPDFSRLPTTLDYWSPRWQTGGYAPRGGAIVDTSGSVGGQGTVRTKFGNYPTSPSLRSGDRGESVSERMRSKANQLISVLTAVVEPELWTVNGGTGATIRYHDGSLIVRAPDFVHRQLSGYPKVPPPAQDRPEGTSTGDAGGEATGGGGGAGGGSVMNGPFGRIAGGL